MVKFQSKLMFRELNIFPPRQSVSEIECAMAVPSASLAPNLTQTRLAG